MNGWIVPHQDIVSHRMMKQRCKKILLLLSIVGGIHQLLWKRKKRNERKEKRKSFPNGQPGREVVGVSLDEHSLLAVFSSASGVPQKPFTK